MLKGDELVGVDNDGLLAAGRVHRFDADFLAVGPGDLADAERTGSLWIQLAELAVAAGDELSGLEVEEHGRVDVVLLLLPGSGPDSALQLHHPGTSVVGKLVYTLGEGCVVVLLLLRGRLVWKIR